LPYVFLHRLQGDDNINRALANPSSVLSTLLAQATAQTLGLKTSTVTKFMSRLQPENLIASLNALAALPRSAANSQIMQHSTEGSRPAMAERRPAQSRTRQQSCDNPFNGSHPPTTTPNSSDESGLLRRLTESLASKFKTRVNQLLRTSLAQDIHDGIATENCRAHLQEQLSEQLRRWINAGANPYQLKNFVQQTLKNTGSLASDAAKNTFQRNIDDITQQMLREFWKHVGERALISLLPPGAILAYRKLFGTEKTKPNTNGITISVPPNTSVKIEVAPPRKTTK
jgi:hypothetical protein